MIARTRRQREIFDYISNFIERHGYEPTYQQIARHFRISSKSAVAKHVVALERQGLISRRGQNGNFALSIQPDSNLAAAVCSIPLLEKLTDDEFASASLFVPRFLFGDVPPERMYAFRVPNDSMIDEHICTGDIALIERKAFARDGECVVALIEDRHPTLERFYDFGAEVELRPANSQLNTLRLPLEFVRICGILRGLLRSSQS
ncbi:MAG TPA: transcriptional repressor LexA [Pyrinomonadaceae bacterium]|jgi:repressor LexA|nr:transcriptional repressor LexA [Pyrinomonadaceae bacterium]